MSSVQIPSICVPRAHVSVTEKLVEQTFDQLFGAGTVRDVDMLLREDYKTGEFFWLMFVHFNNYSPTRDDINLVDCINDFVKRVSIGEELRIQYNAPYFWKAYKTLPAKPADFDEGIWESVPSNSDELEEMIEQMLTSAPVNCR
tara:strand:- start:15 stop:446 length:432 start_codon:yes stop_codon:yes gene_type:complete